MACHKIEHVSPAVYKHRGSTRPYLGHAVAVDHLHDADLAPAWPGVIVARLHPMRGPHALRVGALRWSASGRALYVSEAVVAALLGRRGLLVGPARAPVWSVGRLAAGPAPVWAVRRGPLATGTFRRHARSRQALPAHLTLCLDRAARVVPLAALLALRAQHKVNALEVHGVCHPVRVAHMGFACVEIVLSAGPENPSLHTWLPPARACAERKEGCGGPLQRRRGRAGMAPSCSNGSMILIQTSVRWTAACCGDRRQTLLCGLCQPCAGVRQRLRTRQQPRTCPHAQPRRGIKTAEGKDCKTQCSGGCRGTSGRDWQCRLLGISAAVCVCGGGGRGRRERRGKWTRRGKA